MSGFSTTDTFGSLKDEVISSLQGWGVDNDQLATLSVPIASTTATQFQYTGEISRGIVEIDEELIWVESTADGLANVPAWGRGFKGSTKSTHSTGAMISVSPTFPRAVVGREVNNALRGLYPTLFAIHTTDILTSPSVWQYELPADADWVIGVEWRRDSRPEWEVLTSWEMMSSASTDNFPSGKALAIGLALPGAITLHVTYASPFTLFASDSATLSSTGLHVGARDVLVLGAASRLVPWLDTGRLPSQTVSADLVDQQDPVGKATAIARELRANYMARLQEERKALLTRYPTKVHTTR